MVEIVPDANVKKTISSLKGIKDATPTIKRRVLSSIVSGSKKYVRRSYKTMFTSRTGQTVKSVKHKIYKDGHGTIWMGKRSAYPNIVGSTITPKAGKYLYFTGSDGILRRLKKVELPSRPFFQDPLDKYFSGPEPAVVGQKRLDREIEKLWK